MPRTRDQDACPGALTLHQAADGALARIRLPGGMLTADQLARLAHVAAAAATPALELTSRGNLQLRGITDATAVAEALSAAGLLPSASHERVRNLVASPLSGRAGGVADVRHLALELDSAIQSEPALTDLPGRFWFAIDDGRGDVSGLGTDVGAHFDAADTAALVLAGRDTGIRLAPDTVVPTLVDLASRFTRLREKAWRVAELDDPTELLGGLGRTEPAGRTWPPVIRPPIGWIEQPDGRVTLGAGIPLGVLTARVAEYLAAIGAPLVITPWRSVLVCDLSEDEAEVSVRVLAPMGLVFDESSPWLDISACTGSPGCAKSRADVRADAARAVDQPAPGHRHFVGCERACGSPPTGTVLLATPTGYQPLDRENRAVG